MAMALFLCVIGLLNYFTDPYWYKENRTRNFNYYPINEVVNVIPVMNVFRLYAKGPEVKYSIIGTSHILRGVSDADQPALEKIAVSAMDISESTEVLKKILSEATVPKTIFIEVCGINNEANIRDGSFYTKVFSLRTTIFSLRTIKYNLFNQDHNIRILKQPKNPDTLKSLVELNGEIIPLRPITNEEIRMMDEMWMVNHQLKNNLQHKVVFFISPLPKETMEEEKYKLINQQVSKQMQGLVDSMQLRSHRLKFGFINLADTKIGNEYQFRNGNFYKGWYDGTHFKPIIGTQVVQYLIDHAK